MNKKGLSLVYVLSCAVFLVLLNTVLSLFAGHFSIFGIDLTQNKLFKLSANTVRFLKSLDKDVTIYVLAREDTFVSTSTYNAQANQIFRQFEQNGPKVTLVYVDYVRNPGFAASYPNLTMKQGDILVECKTQANTRSVVVKTEDLFNYAGVREENMSIASSRAEEAIYTAVLSVTSDRPLRVALITGHGEYSMDSFNKILEKNNYEVSRVNLMGGAKDHSIDPSIDLALIAAPKEDYSEAELRQLDDFLINGGNYGKTLFYCADADRPPLPDIGVFLREWGILIRDGAVFETDGSRVYNYQPFYPVADYADEDFHSLMRTGDKPMLLPVSRPLERIFDFRNNYSVRVLLEFAASTGVRPPNAKPDFKSDDALERGPFPALLLASYSLTDRSTGKAAAVSNVLVSGSVAMLDSFAVDNPGFGNTEYLVNALNRLLDRHDIIPLEPKSFTGTGINLPRLTVNIIGLFFMGVVPMLILAAGLAAWMKRKNS